MGAGEVVCTNVVVTTIEPLERRDHVKTIDATAMDMMIVDTYQPVFFAYRLADNTEAVYEQSVKRIKEGLQKVLVSYFPYAGRWIAVSGGAGRQLQCNDKGIPFIEAYVDENLDSVVGISVDFQPVVELQGYSSLGLNPKQLRQPMVPDGLPCAFVQVTRFKCGGLTVAITCNHMIADAKSFFDFMTAWTDLSRTNKTDIVCLHNRGMVGGSAAAFPSDATIPPPPTRVFAVTAYEVSASVIASIKSEVKRSAEGAYVSTLDCISAHLWKSLSSLPLSVTGGKEIGLINTVEGRTRFYNPPLPNLLGNFVTFIKVPNISIAELLEMPLSVIARKIREKFLATGQETWLSPERVAESLSPFMSDNILPWAQTSWHSFPVYKIDFGFGNPIFVPGLNSDFSLDMLGTSCVGPPTPGVSSSAAYILLRTPPEVVDALEDLPDFLPFFLPDKSEKPKQQAAI